MIELTGEISCDVLECQDRRFFSWSFLRRISELIISCDTSGQQTLRIQILRGIRHLASAGSREDCCVRFGCLASSPLSICVMSWTRSPDFGHKRAGTHGERKQVTLIIIGGWLSYYWLILKDKEHYYFVKFSTFANLSDNVTNLFINRMFLSDVWVTFAYLLWYHRYTTSLQFAFGISSAILADKWYVCSTFI